MNPNPHLVSRLAKILDAADFLAIFDNAERASEQSSRCHDGQRADPLPREALSRELTPA